MRRRNVIFGEEEVSCWIEDGMSVGIGGMLLSSHPMVILRQIIRRKVKKLRVVGSILSSLDIDLLIGAGCVSQVVAPYVGAESLAPIGPLFRKAAENGEIEVWECDEGMYFAGLRAAAQMLPFMPWRGGVGTSYPEVNPDLKLFQDPIRGETLLAVPAIHLDVVLVHAAISDPYGNVQHVGTGFGDRALCRAAEKVIAQVEKIVPNEEIKKYPQNTSIIADAVIRSPFGAHPFASPGFYVEDRIHLNEYLFAANALAKEGDERPFADYLKKYVIEPETHFDYLERIGVRRLFSLNEF